MWEWSGKRSGSNRKRREESGTESVGTGDGVGGFLLDRAPRFWQGRIASGFTDGGEGTCPNPAKVLRVRTRDTPAERATPPTVYMRDMWQAVRECVRLGKAGPPQRAWPGARRVQVAHPLSANQTLATRRNVSGACVLATWPPLAGMGMGVPEGSSEESSWGCNLCATARNLPQRRRTVPLDSSQSPPIIGEAVGSPLPHLPIRARAARPSLRRCSPHEKLRSRPQRRAHRNSGSSGRADFHLGAVVTAGYPNPPPLGHGN